MSSIKLLLVGSTYTWKIPVADTDGDFVYCRWASKDPPDECASCVYFLLFFFSTIIRHVFNSVCNGFPDAALNGQSCTMTYTATSTGSWIVALKIEDMEFSSETIPLSSTSVQFLVIVYSNTSDCKTCNTLNNE